VTVCSNARSYNCTAISTCTSGLCPCGPGFTRCVQGHCVVNGERCPLPWQPTCPHWAPVRCSPASVPNFMECRATIKECAATAVCPPGYLMCTDQRSCARDTASCFGASLAPACGPTLFRCPEGTCRASAHLCGTEVMCPDAFDSRLNETVTLVRCPDGTCTLSAFLCASLPACYAPNNKRCPDGSCRSSYASCPTKVTCPRGHGMCPDGSCVLRRSECRFDSAVCPLDSVRCPDGSCQPNLLLCPSGLSCSQGRPIKCPDGSCVDNFDRCLHPQSCYDEKPTRCPGKLFEGG